VAREEEYKMAADIVLEIRKGLEEPLQQVCKGGDGHESDAQVQQQQLDRVLASIQSVVQYFNGRIDKLLPDSLASLQALDDALDSQAVATHLAFHTVRKRTVEWIKSHGQCLDNLVPQVSTLPHAGRGAFAQRFIGKGQVIVPAPLLQIMDFESLNIYEFALDEEGRPYLVEAEETEAAVDDDDDDDDTEMEQEHSIMGQQLLVNYCMSHEETSMYLCPQSNAILLNHCSTRKSYGGDCERYNQALDVNARGANAELRWAIDWDPDTREWLNFTMDEMKEQVKNGKRGLSLEVVATRDIHPGDEVFLDYGKGWEEDWEEHVENFVPPNSRVSHDGEYVPIKELNNDLENNIRTIEELQNNPYPDNANLACIYWPAEEEEVVDDKSAIIDKKGSGRDWQTDGSMYHEKHPDYETYGLLWKCHVVEKIPSREDGSIHYTVEIYSTDGMTVWAANEKQRILTNYPLKSMQFVPSKYSSDQHLLGAFRSYIRIPDELFPNQWRDV
jgi:SET domain.